jgi:hypothetical protein
LTDGNAVAERSLRFLIEKHADSKNLPDHIPGSVTSTPLRPRLRRRARPSARVRGGRVHAPGRPRLDAYRKVATWDGSREKPEAQARFAGLDAYKTAVLGRYR